jgi:hypothetical protein
VNEQRWTRGSTFGGRLGEMFLRHRNRRLGSHLPLRVEQLALRARRPAVGRMAASQRSVEGPSRKGRSRSRRRRTFRAKRRRARIFAIRPKAGRPQRPSARGAAMAARVTRSQVVAIRVACSGDDCIRGAQERAGHRERVGSARESNEKLLRRSS